MRHPSPRQQKPSPQPSPRQTGRGSQTLTALALLAALASTAHAAPPTPETIDAAIKKGVDFLYSVQKPDGTWELDDAPPPPGPVKVPGTVENHGTSDYNQYGNRTAVAVYALLVAGESPTDARLKKAIDHLRTTSVVSVYPLSLRCQVWSNLPPTDENKQALRRDAGMILAQKKLNKDKLLVWDYAQMATPRPNYSLNYVQQAAWGLATAAELNYEVPPDIWKQIDKTFDTAQFPDGGFTSFFPGKNPPKVAPSVYSTATGVSALYLAQDYSRADAYAVPKGNVVNPQIDKAIDWIAKRLADNTEEAGGNASAHRRWYGVGIVALASGLRRLNDQDWYALGSTDILKRQSRAGYWGGKSEKADFRVNDTSWAILFLQRGRVPVAFSKLNYASASVDPNKAMWNQRPRDAANLTRWVGRQTERDLRWQTVTLDDSVDALLESPVLYLAGGEALNLKPEAKAKLKSYAEQGGLIFASADANNAAFAKSVEKLGLELFAGSEWRDVPDTHPIFATQAYKRSAFKGKTPLRALGNGVRELIVLVPSGDPAKTWQLKSGRINADAWQLAANVLSYAVDKSHFFPRGTSWRVADSPLTSHHTFTVARLKYAGPWDAEPAAWNEFAKYAKARDWTIKTTTLDSGAAIKDVDAVYVSGTRAFTLDEPTRAAIKTYLDTGGRIFFEAAGGNDAFTASARAELTRWYGADAIKPLPADHALYGEKQKVSYRTFRPGGLDAPGGPQLFAVDTGGRVVALLSGQDISAGLVGVQTDGIIGYTPESARALLLRVLTRWK